MGHGSCRTSRPSLIGSHARRPHPNACRLECTGVVDQSYPVVHLAVGGREEEVLSPTRHEEPEGVGVLRDHVRIEDNSIWTIPYFGIRAIVQCNRIMKRQDLIRTHRRELRDRLPPIRQHGILEEHQLRPSKQDAPRPPLPTRRPLPPIHQILLPLEYAQLGHLD